MEEEASPPGLGCSKPHLEKLTLGITRILGEGSGHGAERVWRRRKEERRDEVWGGRRDAGPSTGVDIAVVTSVVTEENGGPGFVIRPWKCLPGVFGGRTGKPESSSAYHHPRSHPGRTYKVVEREHSKHLTVGRLDLPLGGILSQGILSQGILPETQVLSLREK